VSDFRASDFRVSDFRVSNFRVSDFWSWVFGSSGFRLGHSQGWAGRQGPGFRDSGLRVSDFGLPNVRKTFVFRASKPCTLVTAGALKSSSAKFESLRSFLTKRGNGCNVLVFGCRVIGCKGFGCLVSGVVQGFVVRVFVFRVSNFRTLFLRHSQGAQILRQIRDTLVTAGALDEPFLMRPSR